MCLCSNWIWFNFDNLAVMFRTDTIFFERKIHSLRIVLCTEFLQNWLQIGCTHEETLLFRIYLYLMTLKNISTCCSQLLTLNILIKAFDFGFETRFWLLYFSRRWSKGACCLFLNDVTEESWESFLSGPILGPYVFTIDAWK